ncbi:M67 family metallopeptidase [Microcoleus sp. LEGE 07076]|uniref:Mov34/MPN/PAD-1 family protein n=1 Tax=Microcoleus sp. LEGE 07076 TaxID=915322 RepID=UPI00187F0E9F|nr:M67 family metallopeptidase [Microcoleus sp. LEGE 07076]MBE9185318.1 M67 family metallopeptidase [Microcoleus sp. LEGE 07076]
MPKIALSDSHLLSIRTHGESAYPEECCGLLLGTIADGVKTLVEVWPTDNAWSAEAEDNWPEQKDLTEKRRYAIAPEDMLRAMKQGRDRNLEIIGIYHSHPDCPAVPSECDRTLAWAQYSYIIVSVQQGCCEDFCSWTLDRENKFQAEEILTVD